MEIVTARTFNYLYIYLDILWLIIYALILISRRRYMAMVAGLLGSIVYFAVDYGIFYLVLNTRVVAGADTLWFLLWLSISYGFTNLAWIWLLLDRDGHEVEWSTLTITGWILVSFLSQTFGTYFQQISISRGTLSYHGIMALILAAGYLYLIIHNLRSTSEKRVNILRLVIIGIGVQFSWESVLLLSNIRPLGIMPLVVNSLIETNMGMPYFYLIHKSITMRFNEDFTRHDNGHRTCENILIA